MNRPQKVVFVVLDAFPHHGVSPDLTPTVWALAAEGGRASEGGRAVLSASTYPNHATFMTGVEPSRHGIMTSHALVDGSSFHLAHEVGPTAPTLFDRCAAAGRRSIAVFGDQYLVGVCGARRADRHWPPEGVLPGTAPTGAFGYGADRAVVDALDTVDPASADLAVIQLDEVDTARHLHGPESPAAFDQCRATDAALGEVLDRFRGTWDRTVFIVVSDHDNEEVLEGAIDLEETVAARGLDVVVDHDGTAALVVGDIDEERAIELAGVTGASELAPNRVLVWADTGRQFGADWGLKGHHGSPRTARQLAVVGGGHPAVADIASDIAGRRPHATEWAPLVARLLGIGETALR